MTERRPIKVIVYGDASIEESPILAGVGSITNEKLIHDMEHGDSVILDTTPPVEIEVRSS